MAFVEDVYRSTRQADSDAYEKQINRLRKEQEAARKRYGSADVTPTSESFGDTLKARATYDQGEQQRREAAAKGKLDLAKAVDTRQANISDRVRAALFDKQQISSDLAEAQRQQDVKQDLTLAEQNQAFRTKSAEIELGRIKNAGERMDAMQSAYDKGMLELDLLDIARNGMLELSDIERYFSILKNDIQNQMRDLDVNSKFDIEDFKKEMEAKSNAISSIIDGLTRIAGAEVTGGL